LLTEIPVRIEQHNRPTGGHVGGGEIRQQR